MAEIPQSNERMNLPKAGQCVVIVAAVVGAWILWLEFRNRGWIPGIARPPKNQVEAGRDAPVKPAPPVSIPPLIAELSNEVNASARREALLKLSSVGPAAAEALDAIRERLQDEDAGVRYAAVLAISRVSQGSERFLPDLRALLDDPHSGVQDVTTNALVAIGRPATGLAIELLNHETPAMCSRGLSILRQIVCLETFSDVSLAMEKLTRDSNPEIRSEALVALVDWGTIDHAGIRILLRTDAKIPGVRPRIDPDRNSRDVAMQAITWLGPNAGDLVPDLVALLEGYPEWEIASPRNVGGRQVRQRTLAPGVQNILNTLSALRTVARPGIPCLLGRLKRLDRYSLVTVIGTLLDIGAEPELLKSSLPDLIGEPNEVVASRLGALLARIDPAKARRQASVLKQKLSDPSKPFDDSALRALGGLGQEAGDTVPLLVSLLSDKRPGATFWAARALRTYPFTGRSVSARDVLFEKRAFSTCTEVRLCRTDARQTFTRSLIHYGNGSSRCSQFTNEVTRAVARVCHYEAS